MAKFCGNCGAQMADEAKVCGNCGTPFAGATVKFEDPEKKAQTQQKQKKAVKLGAAAVAAVLVLILVISFVISNTGYNGLVKKVMSAYKDFDIDTLVSLSSDIYYYGTSEYAENYYESVVGSVLDSMEYEVGHKYKFSYELMETYQLANRKQEVILENLEMIFPEFDFDTIDKIMAAQVEVMAKQGNKTSAFMITIYMSKESGQWKLLQIG